MGKLALADLAAGEGPVPRPVRPRLCLELVCGEGLSRQRCWARSRRALVMTLTDDRAMAAAAMMGDRSKPNAG